MTKQELVNQLLSGDSQRLAEVNRVLASLTARQRIAWTLSALPGTQVLSSSFGIQSAVMLHLMQTSLPRIPVVVIDTGYLFTETYQFIDSLSKRLQLNLHIYRATHSPAWQEARHGQLWQQGLEGLNQYNQINKVEPMQRAFKELGVSSWYAGLRHEQSESRRDLSVLRIQDGRFKVHPIIDWSNRDVHQYLVQHDLPYHPLWEQGYTSVGDYHSSQPLMEGMRDEDTRFFGLKRECGLHE